MWSVPALFVWLQNFPRGHCCPCWFLDFITLEKGKQVQVYRNIRTAESFCLFVWLYHVACEILVPLQKCSLNHWTIREIPWSFSVQSNSSKYKEIRASQVALVVKNPPANAGDIRNAGSIPGSGRSPRGGHGNPLQFSCLENHHGQRSLVGYSPWGHTESNRTEVT